MINAEYLDHLDRVSEGLPGPFSARHGIGHIFALTQKSLLDHGLVWLHTAGVSGSIPLSPTIKSRT